MLRTLIIAGFLVSLGTDVAFAAAARELSPDELRASVDSGRTQSLATALSLVSRNVEGETVDVRAFDSDGICYRILVMQPSGQLVSVIVDAVSGKFLSGSSPRGKQVSEAARNSSGKSSAGNLKNANATGKTNNGKSANAGGGTGGSNAGGVGGDKGNGKDNGKGGGNGGGKGKN